MNRIRVSARSLFPRKSPPGIASDYIFHLDSVPVAHSELPIVLYARESGRTQDCRGNLANQGKNLLAAVTARGRAIVGRLHGEVSSGWIHPDHFRLRFERAITEAKRLNAILLAESTDRFIRPESYRSDTRWDAWPTVDEFERLKEMADGVILATLLHPDTPPAEVRAYQTSRGQQQKGRKGGRPKSNRPGYKKARRLELQPQVLRLRQQGCPIEIIGELTGLPKATISTWISRG